MKEKVSSSGPNMAVSQAVIDHIRQQNLRAGDRLPSELAFAEIVGVSRTLIRETFGALAALNLIDVGNGRCARVGVIDGSTLAMMLAHAVHTEQASVQQIWDVRRALEQRAVALAAMQRTQAEAEEIAKHAREMRRAGDDLVTQTEHDIAFHRVIAEASRNPIFSLQINSFSDLMRETCPIGWRSRRTDEARLSVFDQHDLIAEAILKGDPVAAEQAMAEHFKLSILALNSSGYN